MTDTQSRTYNMAGTTQEVLDDNQPLWNSIPAIVAKHATLGSRLIAISDIQAIQENDTTGLRTLKQLKKRTMATLGTNIAGPLAAWAQDAGKLELFAEINFTFSTLFYEKDVTAIERNRKVLARATTHIASLDQYGILPDALPPLQDAIDQFIELKDTPRKGISVKESATRALAQEFDALRTLLRGLDKVMKPFSSTQPTFYDEYINARKLVDTGGRIVTLRGYVTDAENNAIIQGVVITLVLRGLSTTSGKTGFFQFKSLESGSEDILFEHPDYELLQVNDVVITAGQTLNLSVRLTRSRD